VGKEEVFAHLFKFQAVFNLSLIPSVPQNMIFDHLISAFCFQAIINSPIA